VILLEPDSRLSQPEESLLNRTFRRFGAPATAGALTLLQDPG
jgi:hypothetical protein